MSKTAVSELNARMSIDISQMEQAVPRAIGHLKRLGGAIQAEALASQMSGPDAKAVAERIKAAAKSPGVIGLEGGGRARFKNREDELKFVDDISAANDESLRRRAAREAANRAQQQNAVNANLAEIKLVDDAMAATAEKQAARAREQAEYEQMLADRRAASAKAQIEFADAQRNIISNNAREAAAAIDAEMSRREAAQAAALAGEQEYWSLRRKFLLDSMTSETSAPRASGTALAEMLQAEDAAMTARMAREQQFWALRRGAALETITAETDAQRASNTVLAQMLRDEQRAADDRLATEQQIADVRRRQAQVRTTSEFDRANPFQQQVLAVRELNRLIGVQRDLRRAGVATDQQRLALANAELAVTRQIAEVRELREALTAGTNLNRLGNTAADSQARFARFGLAMQQTGYQVQDFAVQVASGTNALVAFSQQGSQLLGFFGGYQGAIAGAVLSTGILAYRVLAVDDAVQKSIPTIKEAEEAWKEYRNAAKGALEGFMTPEQQLAGLEKTREELNKSQQELGSLMTGIGKVLAMHSNNFGELIGTALAGEMEAYEKWIFPTLEQQLKYVEAVNKAKAEGASIPSPLEDRFGGGALSVFNLSAGDEIESMLTQIGAKFGATSKEAIELTKRIRELREAAKKEETERVSQQNTALGEYEARVQEVRRTNSRFGEDSFETLSRLRREWVELTAPGPQDPLKLEELDGQLLQAEDTVKRMADAYLDQLDPLRAQKRELETIRNLQNEGLLTAEQAELLQLRIADERARQLKLPDMFKAETGASFAGLRNTDGTASQIVATQQQMLAELRKLVYQGSN